MLRYDGAAINVNCAVDLVCEKDVAGKADAGKDITVMGKHSARRRGCGKRYNRSRRCCARQCGCRKKLRDWWKCGRECVVLPEKMSPSVEALDKMFSQALWSR